MESSTLVLELDGKPVSYEYDSNGNIHLVEDNLKTYLWHVLTAIRLKKKFKKQVWWAYKGIPVNTDDKWEIPQYLERRCEIDGRKIKDCSTEINTCFFKMPCPNCELYFKCRLPKSKGWSSNYLKHF